MRSRCGAPGGDLIGADVETALLKSSRIADVSQSGSDSALRAATVGRLAGFDLVVSNAINPRAAYGFIPSAFVLEATRAPAIPAGVTSGSSQSPVTTPRKAACAARKRRDEALHRADIRAESVVVPGVVSGVKITRIRLASLTLARTQRLTLALGGTVTRTRDALAVTVAREFDAAPRGLGVIVSPPTVVVGMVHGRRANKILPPSLSVPNAERLVKALEAARGDRRGQKRDHHGRPGHPDTPSSHRGRTASSWRSCLLAWSCSACGLG